MLSACGTTGKNKYKVDMHMNAQQPATSPRQLAENKYKIARGNLLLMIVFTLLNIVLLFTGSDVMWLFSATIPYYVVIFGVVSEDAVFLTINVVIAAIGLLAYLLCWIFSKKRYGWMIAALVMFIVDTLAMVGLFLLAGEFSGIMDLVFHAWILYYLFLGVTNGRKLKQLPEEVVNAESAVPMENSNHIRWADPEVKHRVFLEAEAAGCRITFRRVKKVNELVINGYVYAEMEMLMESSHMLSAVVNGHLIQAGYESAGSYSYINVDGVQVAKKMRFF